MLRSPLPWLLHSQRRRIRQRVPVLSCPAQKKTSPIISVGSKLRAPLSNAIETGTSVGFSDKKTFGLQTQRKTAFAAIADWCDSAHFRLFAKHS
jgi:hypothetical protein